MCLDHCTAEDFANTFQGFVVVCRRLSLSASDLSSNLHSHVHPLLYEILHGRPLRLHKLVGCFRLHALRLVLRFLRWQSGPVEGQVLSHGTRAGFIGRSCMLTITPCSHSLRNQADKDQISFGAAPAVAGFAIGFRTFFDQLILAFYVLSSLTRLARFNVTVAMLPKDKTGKSQYFEGTPVPFACLTGTAIMATWAFMGWLHESIPLGTVMQGTLLEFHPASIFYIINGCLMVSKTLHVPKP